MANIKEAFEYAAKNPNSDFAKNLSQLASSGVLNVEAKANGIDLSPFQPKEVPVQNLSTQPVGFNPAAQAKKAVAELPKEVSQVVDKAGSILGGKVIGQGLGQAIANPEIAKGQQDLLSQQIAIQGNVLNAIKQAKASGADITHLQNALDSITQDIQKTSSNTGQLLNQNNITPEMVAGDALKLGTTIIGAGKLPGAGKVATGAVGAGSGALQGLKTGAAVGGIYGASSGVSDALINNESVGGVIKSGIEGGVGGAITGGALGAATGAYTGYRNIKRASDATIAAHISSAENNLNGLTTDELNKIGGAKELLAKNRTDLVRQLQSQGLNSQAQKIQNINLGKVTNLQDYKQAISDAFGKADFIDKLLTPVETGKTGLNSIKSGKVQESTGLTGSRDFTGTIPNYDAMRTSLEKVPGVTSGNTVLQNINATHDAIITTAQDLRTQLEANGSSFTPAQFNKYMTKANSQIDDSLLVGDAKETANKILNKFKSLVSENGYTPSGLLDSRQQLDQWIQSQKGTSIFDPAKENAVSVALRAVRQGGNNFLAQQAPEVAVKDMLSHQTNLYNAIDNMAPKALKEGNSVVGRLVSKINKNPVISAAVGGAVGATVLGGAVKKITGL